LVHFELWLIELHLNNEFAGESLKGYLYKLYAYFTSEEFNRKVIQDVGKLYGHYNQEALLTKNEREQEESKLRRMVQINYCKMLFLAVINFNIKTDYEKYPKLVYDFDEINKTYESFIILYFQTLYNYTLNPLLTVYIAAFCLREDKIKALLVEFAKSLTYNDFEKLSAEINIHFSPIAAEITTYIANHANLYNIVNIY
jgi:hypothetical protein